VVEPRPALVPLVFSAQEWAPFAELSGVALEVTVRTVPGEATVGRQGKGGGKGGRRGPQVTEFLEDLLFTHRGLSGPAILQISTFWNPGEPIEIDLASGSDL